ncbi:EpsG family protein [Salmonella enterica]|uniref:EpsG family protein n=1 Tax=Salmonella enterica TaxID=28901 RepID=UPI00273322B6|nr:EpsG family protein [Salmonella enterica]
MCIFLIALLPAFQYGVGTDYFSYQNIYNNANVLDTFYQNKEYLFYAYVKFFQFLGGGFKTFVIYTSFLQSLLIFIIITQMCKNYGQSIIIIFFLFWTVTNLLHTQMNIIRASFAIYIFIISMLFKFRGKIIICFALMIIAIGFHRSALLGLCFALIPLKTYYFAYNHVVKFYFLSFLLFVTPFLHQVVFYIVQELFPYYTHYLFSFDENAVSFWNVATKIYWLPFGLFFIYLIKCNAIFIKGCERGLIGLWILTGNVYLLILNFDFVSRVNFYFVFFYVIPIAYVFRYFIRNKNVILLYISVLYCFIPYLLKVTLFPIAEFYYKTYLF